MNLAVIQVRISLGELENYPFAYPLITKLIKKPTLAQRWDKYLVSKVRNMLNSPHIFQAERLMLDAIAVVIAASAGSSGTYIVNGCLYFQHSCLGKLQFPTTSCTKYQIIMMLCAS